MANVDDLYKPPQTAEAAPQLATAARDIQTADYPGIPTRAIARAVDTLAEYLATFASSMVAVGVFHKPVDDLSTASVAIGMVAPVLHQVVATSIGGASIGKVLLGLRVR